jgi:hypothetical protein
MVKNCVMCNVKLKEDETSVYSCEKCYKKYAFWIICEAKAEDMKKEEEEEEEEEYECEQCSVEVKTTKDLTITYGCMDMKFCEDCYKTSKEEEDIEFCEVCDKVKTNHSGYYTKEDKGYEGFVCGNCFIDCYQEEQYTETEALDSLKRSGWTWPPKEMCLIGECNCDYYGTEFCDGYGTE